MFQIFGIFYI